MSIKGEEHARHASDSFCRKVFQSAASDHYDSINRRREHEVLLDGYRNLPYALDKYSLDREVYEVLGRSIIFTDASIIAALNSLSAEGRAIVFAACVCDLSDGEIAERLNMIGRTLTYRKSKLIKELRGLFIDG